MNIFTYGDYIKSIHTVRLHSIMNLMEGSTTYNAFTSTKEIEDNIIYNNFIKQLLNNKREVAKILNDYKLKDVLEKESNSVDKIKEDDLILLDENYTGIRAKTKKADSVFKLKNFKKDIFIILEYIKSDKNNIEYRMLNYSIDIMQKWIRSKKEYTGKELEDIKVYPIVIPIVVTNESNAKVGTLKYIIDEYKTEDIMKYNIVNINKYLKKFS